MFRRLRLKLTLTNVAVVSIIFIVITLIIYILVKININNQTEQMIKAVLTNESSINSRTIPEQKNLDEHKYRYFFIKLNSSGKIISSSENPDITRVKLDFLISKAMSSANNTGYIESEDTCYKFLRNSSGNELGTFLFFVDTHLEHEILDKMIKALLYTGVAGLLLVFLGSLFMAERSLIPIKQSWKTQRDFVADASHELRTPLAVIQTTLDMLINRKDKTIESQIKWIENLQAENKRMTKLVGDLLFLARADSDQIMLEMKSFSLHTALLEAYIPLEALAIQHKIHLEPFEGSEMEIWGDESRIKQLAVILVDNAIKYTTEGGHIKMALKDKGSSAEIAVSNTGEGISKEHINKIFKRFYRVDKSRSRREGSLGLGLSIAEWIVHEHHGSIKVESSTDTGTTFYVTLPKAKD